MEKQKITYSVTISYRHGRESFTTKPKLYSGTIIEFYEFIGSFVARYHKGDAQSVMFHSENNILVLPKSELTQAVFTVNIIG